MEKIILHADMDAFFAAVEQRDHPEFIGKPVIIGADPLKGQGRGVVSTCSYEARKFGVHSAMPVSKAYKLCPHGIYMPPNGGLYAEVSKEIFKIFYEFTDLVEPLSIDEAFLDISGSMNLFASKEAIGRQLKKRIVEAQQLNASVGIAPSKFIAKIASDIKKPDGLVIVEKEEVQAFLDPLPLSCMWGAGRKTIEKMARIGVRTIGDLARLPLDILELRFGKHGEHFYRLAHGIDERNVIPEHEVKSVSNEVTFSHDITDMEKIYNTLSRLTEKVGYRMRQQHLKGRTIHLKLRYEGFETITRNRTIDFPTANTEVIHKNIRELFDTNYQSHRKVRLLGVGVSGFKEANGEQLSIFNAGSPSESRLDAVADLVKEKFGRNSISRAEGLKPKRRSGN